MIVDALRTLDGEGLAPATIAVREPSLDDVFLALTGRRVEPEETRRGSHARCSMTAQPPSLPSALTPDLDLRGLRRFTTAVSDTFAVMARNLIAYRRVPQLLIFSTIQPVVFVLLFRYVFGGAISVPGVSVRRLPDAGDLRPDG